LSPGKVGRNSPLLMTASGSGKRFTDPSDCFVVLVTIFWVGTASPWICQLVDQVEPLLMLTGKPLDQRANPESCQPPISPLSPPLASFAKILPLPKGNS